MNKKHFSKFSALFLVTLLSLAAVPAAHAGDTAWTKFGRGLQNTLFGWMEILYQPTAIHKDGVEWPIAVPAGILKGIPWALARTGVGLYEVVTFPFPVPEGYKPIMKPESLLSKGYREYNETGA